MLVTDVPFPVLFCAVFHLARPTGSPFEGHVRDMDMDTDTDTDAASIYDSDCPSVPESNKTRIHTKRRCDIINPLLKNKLRPRSEFPTRSVALCQKHHLLV